MSLHILLYIHVVLYGSCGMAPSPCILYMLRLWQVTCTSLLQPLNTSVVCGEGYLLFGFVVNIKIIQNLIKLKIYIQFANKFY